MIGQEDLKNKSCSKSQDTDNAVVCCMSRLCMCVYACVCLSLCVNVCVPVCAYVSEYVCMYECV